MKTRRKAAGSNWSNRDFRAVILVAGLLLTASACALGVGAPPNQRSAKADESAVQVNVTNHSGGPMEIYAAGPGTSYRMGTVLPGFVSHFVLRQGMILNGPVEFLAQSGNRGPLVRSGQLLLRPGDAVDFELGSNPVNSIATVRP